MGVAAKLKRKPPIRKSRFELARDNVRDRVRSQPAVVGAVVAGAGALAYAVKKLIDSVTAGETTPANDQHLADKVRSELFQPAEAPKGSVNVNVENGVLYLRGRVEDAGQADELLDRARSIEGVHEVKSLLHTPGQPAPMANGSGS